MTAALVSARWAETKLATSERSVTTLTAAKAASAISATATKLRARRVPICPRPQSAMSSVVAAQPKTVPAAEQGLDDLGVTVLNLDFVPQVLHMRVHCAFVTFELVAPH